VTALLWLIFVLNLMANNLMNAWLPMIVQSSGHSATQGAYAGSLYQLGGTIGGLCMGILIDRFGLKVLVAVFALAVPVLVFTWHARHFGLAASRHGLLLRRRHHRYADRP
jgi:MFS transporter, AAHS family, 4-hydroxybenzoate transporter